MRDVGLNWAGNYHYTAQRLLQPRNVEELQEQTAAATRLRAVGSRHSFSPIADTSGDLVSLSQMPRVLQIDEVQQSVTVDAGMRYGEVAVALQQHGWALSNTASLPHITVVGSVATGTHGSGDSHPPLSSAVQNVTAVLPNGQLRTFRRGEQDFEAAVVNLGLLGIVTELTLDIVPSYSVRQDVYDGLPWESVLENFDHLSAAGYSVSLFTLWEGEKFGHAWVKSVEDPPERLLGIAPLTYDIGLVEGAVERTTAQSGAWGSWDQRIPHFRLDFTPSNGDELQSEYLVPREHAVEAMRRIRQMAGDVAPHLFISEIRTMAADQQWMSPAYGRDTVGFHFTWRQHPEAVAALLPQLEERLDDLGARPHWAKLTAAEYVADRYPRVEDFLTVAQQVDPESKLHNAYMDRLLGLSAADGR